MDRKLPSRAIANSYVLPVATAVAAIAIFVLDTISDVGVAVGILFVPVVLMAARFCQARGVVLVSLGCAALTVLSHYFSPGDPWSNLALVNRFLGLTALGVTTFLVVKSQSTNIALREQAGLLDLTHDTVFVRDANDVITYWNRGAKELYGWTQEEAVGKSSHQLLRTIFPEPLEEITSKLSRTGRWEGELVHHKRDGTQVIAASRWSLQQDKPSRGVGILETNNDITERKHADAKLQRSEPRYRNIFETTSVSIWEENFSAVKAAIDDVKAHGVGDFRRYLAEHPEFVRQAIPMVKIIDVNETTVKLFAASSKDELLVSMHRIFTLEAEDVFAGELIALAEGQSSFASEAVLRSLNGDKLDVLFTVSFPVEPGKMDSALVSIIDITARKQAQEELQQAQTELGHVSRVTTLGELAASIAHEVNQPLAAVGANADAALRWLAAQPPDLEEAREALSGIVRDGRRAGEIIKRIRALVKKAPAQKEQLDINEAIREVIVLTRGEARKSGVLLQTQLAADLLLVSADRIQLQQVILNLIVNAIEAVSGTAGGERHVLIGTEKHNSTDVLVAVRDSGPGLEAESFDRVFDAFYTTKPNGIGMGLAISSSIIAGHGGRLWATPNAPCGAIFRFTLPPHQEAAS